MPWQHGLCMHSNPIPAHRSSTHRKRRNTPRNFRTFAPLKAWFVFLTATIALVNSALGQLESRPAAEWIKTLDSSNRVARLKIDETIAKLKIKPGEVIADVGAGSGVFCPPLARAVLPAGKV